MALTMRLAILGLEPLCVGTTPLSAMVGVSTALKLSDRQANVSHSVSIVTNENNEAGRKDIELLTWEFWIFQFKS